MRVRPFDHVGPMTLAMLIEGRKCGGCMYWEPESYVRDEDGSIAYPEQSTAECHRHAPIYAARQNVAFEHAEWPTTHTLNGCGDFHPAQVSRPDLKDSQ